MFGTESPPVATITASASSGAAPSQLDAPAGRPSARARSPASPAGTARRAGRASASRPSRTSRARFDAGNSLADSGSSTSGRPSSRSKNAICSASGHERRILRSVLGEESVTKRDSSTRVGRMLQRPPPLMRILRPPSRVRSSSSVSAPAAAAKIAAIEPAAPAPMTATRRVGIGGMYYSSRLATSTEASCFRSAPPPCCWRPPRSPGPRSRRPAALRGFTAESARAEREWESKFQAIPDPDSLREYMRVLSARPHHLGSPRDSANAAWILDRFRAWGLDAQIETFHVLFPTPLERVVELVRPRLSSPACGSPR